MKLRQEVQATGQLAPNARRAVACVAFAASCLVPVASQADITLSNGESFPLAGRARIVKTVTVGSISGTRTLTYDISTASDPYARYFRVYVDGVEAFERIVFRRASGSINLNAYVPSAGTYTITFEIHWGGYRSWRLNGAVLRGADESAVVLEGDTLVVATPGGEEVRLRGNWTATASGYRATGWVYVTTPFGEMGISTIELVAEVNPVNISGRAFVPFPQFSFFEGLTGGTPQASVGLAAGSELDFDVPLRDDRYYLFFAYDAGFSVSFDNATLEVADTPSSTLVLDPLDPFVYVDGELLGVGEMLSKAGVEDLGLGFSLQRLIPFDPAYPVWDGSRWLDYPIDGHLFAKGDVQLGRYPLVIGGDVTVDVDADGDGTVLAFLDDMSDTKVGANGTLKVGYTKRGFDLTLDVAAGTAVFDNQAGTPGEGMLLFYGESLDSSLLAFQPQTGVDVYGYYDAGDDFVWIRAAGDYTVGGYELANAMIELSNDGVVVSGEVDVAGSSIAVSGSLDRYGNFSLSSDGQVNVPLTGGTLKATVVLQKSGSTVSLGGSGSIRYAGVDFSSSFSVATNGRVSFESSLSVSGSIDVQGHNVGSLTGQVSLEVSNNVVDASFSGTACFIGGRGCISVGGSVNSSGVICFDAPFSVPYPCAKFPPICFADRFCVDVL